MNLQKLRNRYSKAGQERTSKIREYRESLEALPKESAKLLAVNFRDWCESLRIKTPNGLKPFKLFDWQKETADLITGPNAVKNRTIVVLSSRQTGKTSLFLALAGYFALSVEQFTGLILHKTGQDVGLLARRLKMFLPEKSLTTDNLSLFEFFTNSVLHFRSCNSSRGAEGAEIAGRGLPSVDLLFADEMAHCNNLADVLGVVSPCLTWGSPKLTILVGTAGSKTSHFYSLLCKAAAAEAGVDETDGEFELQEVLARIRNEAIDSFVILNKAGPGPIGVISNWRCIDQFRNEPNFLERVQSELNLSDDQVSSEYEMHFSHSGDQNVFDFSLVQNATKGDWEKDAEYGGVYYVGVDSSAQGMDYTVCLVLEKLSDGSFRAVKLYRKRKGTSEFHLESIAQIIREFDPIRTFVETNNVGQIYLENLNTVLPTSEIVGFVTSQQSKEAMIGRINLALEGGQLSFPRSALSGELLTFRRSGLNGQKLEAATGHHDDTVIALGLALSAANFGRIN